MNLALQGLMAKRRSIIPVTWTQQTSSFSTDLIYGVEYGSDGYWVATGANDKIASCTDPTGTWTQRTSNITGFIYDSYYNGTHWVIVGKDGYIATATDPTGTWTAKDLSGSFSPNAISVGWDGTYWTVAGSGGGLVTATDPTGTWTDRTSNLSGTIYGCLYANSLWVIAGQDDTNIATATNPTGTWTTRTNSFGTDLIYDIGYGDGYWVMVGAGGKMAYSTDPTSGSFTQITGGSNPFSGTIVWSVAYGDGIWVAVGAGGKLATTSDPTGTWTLQTSSFSTDLIRQVRYGDEVWVAVGADGKLATAVNGL